MRHTGACEPVRVGKKASVLTTPEPLFSRLDNCPIYGGDRCAHHSGNWRTGRSASARSLDEIAGSRPPAVLVLSLLKDSMD